MKKASRFIAKCAAIAGVTAVVHAADLETGEWTGTVTPPMAEATPATFTVGDADGEVQISISNRGMMLDFRDIEVTDDGIAFTWSPGPDVRCELELHDDGSYAGPCTDPDGGIGRVTMVPPE